VIAEESARVKPQRRSIVKREEIVKFIADYQDFWKYPPTFEEVTVGCNLSTKSLTDYHLQALAAEGRVTWQHYMTRTLQVIEPVPTSKSVQFCSLKLRVDNGGDQAL